MNIVAFLELLFIRLVSLNSLLSFKMSVAFLWFFENPVKNGRLQKFFCSYLYLYLFDMNRSIDRSICLDDDTNSMTIKTNDFKQASQWYILMLKTCEAMKSLFNIFANYYKMDQMFPYCYLNWLPCYLWIENPR